MGRGCSTTLEHSSQFKRSWVRIPSFHWHIFFFFFLFLHSFTSQNEDSSKWSFLSAMCKLKYGYLSLLWWLTLHTLGKWGMSCVPLIYCLSFFILSNYSLYLDMNSLPCALQLKATCELALHKTSTTISGPLTLNLVWVRTFQTYLEREHLPVHNTLDVNKTSILYYSLLKTRLTENYSTALV